MDIIDYITLILSILGCLLLSIGLVSIMTNCYIVITIRKHKKIS